MTEISVCIPTYEYKGEGVKYLNELLKSLTNNFSINQLKNTNILNYKNDKLYDPMRGRIIFPITDISNRIISKT